MDRDIKKLLVLVRSAINASRAYKHEIESAMGIGHGRLEDLFSGDLELRVRHLVGLADHLGIPPSDFLRLGYPEAERTLRRRLEDWIGEVQPPFARRDPAPLDAPLEARLRELVRDELAKSDPQLIGSARGKEPA
ncbi:MAG TPA: hypothetical protein VN783_01870 [Thermoanaerobaculia bacterium]|nr:hypothetical protein [Thermoanaerobaculia bacterium]